jgi:hypothetical protein
LKALSVCRKFIGARERRLLIVPAFHRAIRQIVRHPGYVQTGTDRAGQGFLQRAEPLIKGHLLVGGDRLFRQMQDGLVTDCPVHRSNRHLVKRVADIDSGNPVAKTGVSCSISIVMVRHSFGALFNLSNVRYIGGKRHASLESNRSIHSFGRYSRDSRSPRLGTTPCHHGRRVSPRAQQRPLYQRYFRAVYETIPAQLKLKGIVVVRSIANIPAAHKMSGKIDRNLGLAVEFARNSAAQIPPV